MITSDLLPFCSKFFEFGINVTNHDDFFVKMLGDTLTTVANYLEPVWTLLNKYVDVDYATWLFWLFAPIVFAFIFPLLLAVFIYGCALFLHVYKLRNKLREAYAVDVYHGARTTIASFWDAQGWIWHGYELIGLNNIPDTGPALIVYYHGTLPIDVYYILAKCLLYKKRLIHCVGDKFLTRIPGWKTLMEVFCVAPGSIDTCSDLLKQGNLLCISPGGVREALFSDSDKYDLLWSDRLGFAKVAIQAKAPIIPMFTENCREGFRTPAWARRWLRKFYERTRLPIVPIYGGFPVKLRTYLGPPIPYDPDVSPEELRDSTKAAVEKLIQSHQRLPGNILRALLDRVHIWKKPQTE